MTPPNTIPNDFCHYVNQPDSLNDQARLSAFSEHFQPNLNFKFPITTEYGKARSFQHSWLEEHSWLVYSPCEDGAYCKVCVMFGKAFGEKNASKIDKLVKTPLKFLTTASTKFKDHENKSQMHKFAVVCADRFLMVMKNQAEPIEHQLSSRLAAQIAENRQKLSSVIKTVLCCGQHNLPLRGHREGGDSKNQGIFIALLKFHVDSGDEVLKQHFQSGPRNAQYTSKTVQNEIIGIIASHLQKTMLEKSKVAVSCFQFWQMNQEMLPIKNSSP